MSDEHVDLADVVSALASSTRSEFASIQERFEQVHQRFEQVHQRFEQVDKKFEQVDRRFDDVLRAIQVSTEANREMIAKAAEGYSATIERFRRDIATWRADQTKRIDLHELVLADHAGRIAALERE